MDGFEAVFENETPKEPQITYNRNIAETEKHKLADKIKEAANRAKKGGITNIFVAKGVSTNGDMAMRVADSSVRAMPGSTVLTGTYPLISELYHNEKDKKYTAYTFMGGSTNTNQNSMPATVAETSANADVQGDTKEPVNGQTDVAPAAQTTPKPAQVQTNQQIPQAVNDIAQKVGTQVRTNKQGFPVIRKGNLLTTFNTKDRWVSFYDLTKKQRVASFRYADDNDLAQRVNAMVKSINDLSIAGG